MAPVDGPLPPKVSFTNTGIVTCTSSSVEAMSLVASGKQSNIFKVIQAVSLHPFAVCTITLYAVVTAGETVNVFAVPKLAPVGLHPVAASSRYQFTPVISVVGVNAKVEL